MHLRLRGLCNTAPNSGPALVLEDAPGLHRLAIGVPACEAPRLAHEIRRGALCEPSIYTAAAALLGRLRTWGAHVWIDLQDGSLVAQLRWGAEGGPPPVPCAARDLVVLAAVAGLPLIASEALARQIRGCPPDATPPALTDARTWLDRVRPEDFA